jgi:threonyl-tRNA synthetase
MNDEQLHAMRHSLAHVTAAAVKRIWPGAKFGVGPVIEDGYYYDIDLGDTKISEQNFSKIEKTMRRIIAESQEFEQFDLPIDEAIDWAKETNQPYKQELLNDLKREGTTLASELDQSMMGIDLPAGISGSSRGHVESVGEASFYRNGDFTDLCRGPHVKNTKEVGVFKLMRVAGAYWRGNEKNPQMQRLYGVAFETQAELDEYLERLEQAKLRDHRKLGRELDLYFIDDEYVGKGLIMWSPAGTILRDNVENLAKQYEKQYGYQRVVTPHIAKDKLFLRSGHLPYYEKDMYPAMKMDDGTYYLKAMNCPHHHRIFQSQPRSYRGLPLRLAEYGTCYRNELSGTLAGLLRVRALAMNDAHIYCTRDQVKAEFARVLDLTQEYFKVFGLKDYWFRLSKWSPAHTDKYIDEPENWQYTQDVLREVLVEKGVEFQEADDEAAFYGPKVDVQFKSVLGREETMSTIQLDFAAKTRFEFEYTDDRSQKSNDVFVIHRAPLSVHERFLAFLIEHYAGWFPLWLAPEQVRILTINDTVLDYVDEIKVILSEIVLMKPVKYNEVRFTTDNRNESLGKKIREATALKIPVQLIVGPKDKEARQVSVRTQNGEEKVPLDALSEYLKEL